MLCSATIKHLLTEAGFLKIYLRRESYWLLRKLTCLAQHKLDNSEAVLPTPARDVLKDTLVKMRFLFFLNCMCFG